MKIGCSSQARVGKDELPVRCDLQEGHWGRHRGSVSVEVNRCLVWADIRWSTPGEPRVRWPRRLAMAGAVLAGMKD